MSVPQYRQPLFHFDLVVIKRLCGIIFKGYAGSARAFKWPVRPKNWYPTVLTVGWMRYNRIPEAQGVFMNEYLGASGMETAVWMNEPITNMC